MRLHRSLSGGSCQSGIAQLIKNIALFFFFTQVAQAQDKKASDYYVKSLPGAPAGPLLKMHAG